jgi:hypothetical protein
MSSSRGLRFVLCLAAALAVVGLHASIDGTASTPKLSGTDHIIAVHGDVIAGTVAFRTETLVQDEVQRSTKSWMPLFALAASAIALLAIGHHRRSVPLAGATQPSAVALRSSPPRAPPLRLS